jgi:hypothetical protein
MWTKVPVKQRFTDNRTSASYAANIGKSNGSLRQNNTSNNVVNSKDSMISRTGNNISVTNDTNIVNEENAVIQTQPEYCSDIEVSQKNLTEAIIWSEILGKPMCKRRARR